ncbi:MAG: hypothetical protein P8X90_20775 [Desulfobacterales bacterium]|jgi:hypothetical protein
MAALKTWSSLQTVTLQTGSWAGTLYSYIKDLFWGVNQSLVFTRSEPQTPCHENWKASPAPGHRPLRDGV